MWDLIIAAVILAAVSLALFFGACVATRRLSPRSSAILAVVAVMFLLGFGAFAHGKLLVASVLPFSAAIILGNGLVPGVAVLAGIVVGQRRIPVWRRGLLTIALAGIGLASVVCNFTGSHVDTRNRWTADGVCLQSDPASCSPASAATLLAHHGIAADDQTGQTS